MDTRGETEFCHLNTEEMQLSIEAQEISTRKYW